MESKNRVTKYNKLEILYVLLMYILIFQNFIQKNIDWFRYADEILAIIGVIIGFLFLLKNKLHIKKRNLIIVIMLTIILITGFYSVIKYKYQTLTYAIIDSLLVVKFFSTYCLSQIVFKNINKLTKSNIIRKNIKIITIILLVFTICNYAFDIYKGEIRYGIKSNKLFFEHPTYLAAICIALIANNLIFNKNINNIYTYILILILASTLRFKALGAVIQTRKSLFQN